MYNISINKISGENKNMVISAHDVPIEDVKKIIDILLPVLNDEEVPKAMVIRPKCMYCEHAKLKESKPPCYSCYYTYNRPNFEPNERYKELCSKIKEEMEKNKSKPKYMTDEAYKEWREEMEEEK